jgi:hypothetical protein
VCRPAAQTQRSQRARHLAATTIIPSLNVGFDFFEFVRDAAVDVFEVPDAFERVDFLTGSRSSPLLPPHPSDQRTSDTWHRRVPESGKSGIPGKSG